MTPLARALKQYAAICQKKRHAQLKQRRARDKKSDVAAALRPTVTPQLPWVAPSSSCRDFLSAKVHASDQKEGMLLQKPQTVKALVA
jgi:hypothetical protein